MTSAIGVGGSLADRQGRGVHGQRGADLVGEGGGHDALLERGAGRRVEVEDEAADDLAPRQHRQGDAVGRELDLEVAAGPHPEAPVGHDAVALQLGQVEAVVERSGLEAAVDEVEEVDELRPGGGDHVGRLVALGHPVGQPADPVEPAPAAVALVGHHPGPPGELSGQQADHQEEDGHLHVVAVVDEQRQIGPGEEEVIGGGGGEAGDHAGRAAAVGPGGDHDEAEDQGDVRRVHLSSDHHEGRPDEDRGEAAEGDVDGGAGSAGGRGNSSHVFVLRLGEAVANGIDAPLTRRRGFLTRHWRPRPPAAPTLPFVPLDGRFRRMLAGWAVTLVGLAVATAGLVPFRSGITTATAALVLVVPVALGVAVGGFPAVPFGVVAGFLTFDFVFIPPYYTFYVTAGEDWVSLVVYACVGCTVGVVVARLRRAQREAEARRAEAQALWAGRERLVEESNRVRLLEEVDRLRGALMGSVSHDLRTPLASIKASISDLADPGLHLSDEDRALLLRTTEEETDRLTRLVTNLLDMSRIQAGALVLHRSATPLDELVGGVAARLAPLFRDHRLTLDVPEGLPLVDVDYLLVEQVLSNLLENAARHTPAGTGVTLRAAAVAGEVEVAVVDHGPGVAEE